MTFFMWTLQAGFRKLVLQYVYRDRKKEWLEKNENELCSKRKQRDRRLDFQAIFL